MIVSRGVAFVGRFAVAAISTEAFSISLPVAPPLELKATAFKNPVFFCQRADRPVIIDEQVARDFKPSPILPVQDMT